MSDAEKGLRLVKSVKSVSRETQERLTVFHDLLLKWQGSINLIAPSTIREIWSRHIADSVQCSVLMPEAKSIIDIGSGAGFPGMILAILMADNNAGPETENRLDFIESSGKKCAFLNAVLRELRLRNSSLNVQVHHGRIEDVIPNLPRPDVVCARALASLDDLFRLSQCHLTQGSVGIFPKGRGSDEEIQKAQQNWRFDLNTHESRFEEGSVILEVSNLAKR